MGKSEVLKFRSSGEQEPLRVRLGSEEVEETTEFKCLESMASVNGGMGAELKHSLGEGSKTVGGLPSP